MKVTFLGHACFLIEVHKTKLLFDPYISPNHLAQSVDIDAIKPNYILVSHGHYDHLADVERIYHNYSNTTFIANPEIISWYKKRGIEKSLPINSGGKRTFEFGTIKAVSELHSSAMPDGSYGGNPIGFVVQSEGKAFYFAGDTMLHQDMKQIGEFYAINFAILPIGDTFTMDLEAALHAADYVGTQTIIGMHYDTFEEIEIDHQQAHQLAEKHSKKLFLMDIGQSIEL